MKIILATTDFKKLELDVEPSDTIADLRRLLLKNYNIPFTHFIYSFLGKTLFDHQTFYNHNVQLGSTIHQRVGLPGGFLDDFKETCSLCGEIALGKVGLLYCSTKQKEFYFHTPCVSTWMFKINLLFKKQKWCPTCRKELKDNECQPNEEKVLSKQAKTNDEKLCVICMEQLSSVANIPCGHVCSCIECSIKFKNCPICRNHIDSKQQLYF